MSVGHGATIAEKALILARNEDHDFFSTPTGPRRYAARPEKKTRQVTCPPSRLPAARSCDPPVTTQLDRVA
jgi:hypothetical protein